MDGMMNELGMELGPQLEELCILTRRISEHLDTCSAVQHQKLTILINLKRQAIKYSKMIRYTYNNQATVWKNFIIIIYLTLVHMNDLSRCL